MSKKLATVERKNAPLTGKDFMQNKTQRGAAILAVFLQ